ncbi:MAG: hypothetical protein ACK4GU_16135 [Alishewanella aestuarii]
MSRKNWNQLVARSLTESLQLCKEFAIANKQMSVPRIADRIGTSPDMLYKHLGAASMPAYMMIPYMESTHRIYPLQYMAHSLNHLLVPMPRGRKAEHKTLIALSQFCNAVMGQMLALQSGECRAQDVTDQLTLLMENLAYHRMEAQKHDQPELELFPERADV